MSTESVGEGGGKVFDIVSFYWIEGLSLVVHRWRTIPSRGAVPFQGHFCGLWDWDLIK